MAQYKAFATGVEVNGETVLSVVDGMGVFKSKAYQILERNGIVNPQPGQWYPQQAWLNAFKQIAEEVGENTLYQIGMSIPKNAKFPEGIDTLGKALVSIDQAYHMNHQGGEIGHYTMERIDNHSAKMICNNPYPCDFDRGIIMSFTNIFKPLNSDKMAKVRHDDSAPCRKKGGNSCTYIISW